MSVRGERVVYRERDDYVEEPRRAYTTVKRYQVPESTARSVFHGDEEVTEDKVIIRRERKESSPPKEEWKITERIREREPVRDEVDYKITERVRERDRDDVDFEITERIRQLQREREAPRRDIAYRVIERDNDFDRRSHHSHHSHSLPRSEFRVVERDREIVRAPSPPLEPEPERVREFRFERERDFSPGRRRTLDRPYDLEKYSKSTEYFAQPQPIIIREPAPQPIIIREERRDPVIIREERREPHYEFIEREEVKEQSLVKREEPPAPVPVPVPVPAPTTVAGPEPEKPEEENYFYERRIREVDRSKRRDDSYERRTEIRPRDSASQYSSDDSYEYVRKERTYEGDRERDHSPHHRRHLAEGAIAGIGAAEILRHHRKSEGKAVGGRLRDGAAGAAVGALGAEALSRVRSARSKSRRSRSRSSSYEDRRDRRHRRSRSREKSMSRAQQLGGLAAVAAVGALAGYALNKKSKQETIIVNDPPRRSRSRRRRGSLDSYYDDRLSEGGGRALNPEHRNRRIAQAGLASAAAAGIWERVRSKSRGARSKSRIRQGVPIAAAGLGGAALAGLYENSKANKERKREAELEEEANRGRRRHSRSRSRSVPEPYPEDDRSVDDRRGMIAYGNEPIYPEQPARGYYSDEEPGMYRRRHRGGSSNGSSPDTRRRSRSRARDLAEAGAAAGVAAVAGHELGKRRERSRQRATVEQRRKSASPLDSRHSLTCHIQVAKKRRRTTTSMATIGGTLYIAHLQWAAMRVTYNLNRTQPMATQRRLTHPATTSHHRQLAITRSNHTLSKVLILRTTRPITLKTPNSKRTLRATVPMARAMPTWAHRTDTKHTRPTTEDTPVSPARRTMTEGAGILRM
jgi:hypothetical protein